MNAKRWSRLIIAVLCCCLVAPVVHAQSGTRGAQAFARGITAFRQRNYAQALTEFLAARQFGIDAPQLGYDLGVTYYHLGRYSEARHEFSLLTSIPDLAALAHYNLGLIAMHSGDRSGALAQFDLACRLAPDAQLRTLAAEARSRLDSGFVSQPNWTAFFDTGAGYDNNVALTSESTVLAPTHTGSSVASLLAGVTGQLSGREVRGWQVVGTYYRMQYPSVSQFNQTYLHVGSQYRWSPPGWSNTAGFYLGDLTLGRSNFETLATVSVDVKRHLGNGDELRAYYRYTRVRGDGVYDYLTGWHQSLGAESVFRFTHTEFTLGYSFDFNERNNYNSASQFLSASPTENGLYAVLDWHRTPALNWSFEADYQHSHYQGADFIPLNGATTSVFREENWLSAVVRLNYTLSDRWALRADWRFTDNRSNIPVYSYRSSQVMLSLEYVNSR